MSQHILTMILYRFVLWSIMMEIEENRQSFVDYLILKNDSVTYVKFTAQGRLGINPCYVDWCHPLSFLSDSFCLLSLQKTLLKILFYSFYHLTRSLSDDAWNGIHMYASWRIISPQHWDHTAQWGLIRSSSSWVPLCTALSSGIWCLKWFEWLIRKRIKASCHTLKCQ